MPNSELEIFENCGHFVYQDDYPRFIKLIQTWVNKQPLKRMVSFIQELKLRNEHLFYFGVFCIILSIVCIVLTKTTTTEVQGVNAWFKPLKFATSIGLFSWTMAGTVIISSILMLRLLIGR